MHSPAEALAELEFCHDGGLKVVSIPHGVLRPIPAPVLDGGSPYLWPGQRHWFDTFGLDSEHDYDPVWRRFRELGYAVTAHGGMTLPVGVYSSTTSFTFNHLGSFMQMMYPLVKSIFLGGVTARFPDLPFAFLECGVSWACTLLHDLVEHWEKRSRDGIEWTNPANLDLARMEQLMREHGGDFPALEDRLGELIAPLANPAVTTPDCLDEWIHVGIERATDIRDRFVDSFYFGCEADDRTTAFAFSPANEFGARLRAVLSSDIGHWDVRNMDRVMPQAWSMVEDGLLTREDFADFSFRNPVRLHTAVCPDFFDGTAVAEAVRAAQAVPGTAGVGRRRTTDPGPSSRSLGGRSISWCRPGEGAAVSPRRHAERRPHHPPSRQRRSTVRALGVVAAVLLAAIVPAWRVAPAGAATFVVTDLGDAMTPGTLRWAITSANAAPGPDEIDFDPSLNGTITLTAGDLLISDDLVIAGSSDVTISGGGISRAVHDRRRRHPPRRDDDVPPRGGRLGDHRWRDLGGRRRRARDRGGPELERGGRRRRHRRGRVEPHRREHDLPEQPGVGQRGRHRPAGAELAHDERLQPRRQHGDTGGGIATELGAGPVDVSGTYIQSNTASIDGGGVA